MLRAFFKTYKEIISYVIVGILTTIVSLGSYSILVSLVLSPQILWQLQLANIFSWICSVTFAFWTNRKYVFRSTGKRILGEAVKFYSARASTLLIDMICMLVLVTILSLNDKIAKILVQIIVFISNYLLSKFFVFGRN